VKKLAILLTLLAAGCGGTPATDVASNPGLQELRLCVAPTPAFAAWRGGAALPWLAAGARFWEEADVPVEVLGAGESAPGCVSFDFDPTIQFGAGPANQDNASGVYFPSKRRAAANLDAIWFWLACDGTLPCGGDDGLGAGPRALLDVFAHELGHSLGLGHLADRQAVMYADAHAIWGLSPADVAALPNR